MLPATRRALEHYEVVKKHLKARFKELQFQTSGDRWFKQLENGLVVVGLKTKRGTIGSNGFTVNLGYGSNELYGKYDYPHQGKIPHTHNCHHSTRIGKFNARFADFKRAIRLESPNKQLNGKKSSDIWWKMVQKGSDRKAIDELDYLLFEIALPKVVGWDNPSVFKTYLESVASEDNFERWVIMALSTDKHVPADGFSRFYPD